MKTRTVSYLRVLFIPIIISLIGWGLFSLSYCLPTEVIRTHMAESVHCISDDAFYQNWIKGNATARNDEWSEGEIMLITVCPTDPADALTAPLKLASVGVTNTEFDLPADQLAVYLSDPNAEVTYGSNNRYWNGLVMVLKFLYMFFNLEEIRLLNMFIQISLLGIIFYEMGKQNMRFEIPVFLLILYVMNPASLMMSIKFIPEFVIALLGTIFILRQDDSFFADQHRTAAVFTIIGTCTSFFNMLSFPLIALGIPMLFYIWKSDDQGIQMLRNVMLGIVTWFFGYMLCWGCKWIACTLFTDENLLADALNRAKTYHEVDEDLLATVLRSLHVYNLPIHIVLFASVFVRNAVIAVHQKHQSTKRSLPSLLAYALLIIVPYLFFAVFGPGYAYVHYFMAYRNLSISFAAMLCIPFCFIDRQSHTRKQTVIQNHNPQSDRIRKAA